MKTASCDDPWAWQLRQQRLSWRRRPDIWIWQYRIMKGCTNDSVAEEVTKIKTAIRMLFTWSTYTQLVLGIDLELPINILPLLPGSQHIEGSLTAIQDSVQMNIRPDRRLPVLKVVVGLDELPVIKLYYSANNPLARKLHTNTITHHASAARQQRSRLIACLRPLPRHRRKTADIQRPVSYKISIRNGLSTISFL